MFSGFVIFVFFFTQNLSFSLPKILSLFVSHFPFFQPKISVFSLPRNPNLEVSAIKTQKLSVKPHHPSLSTTLPAMGQIISVIRRSSKRKRKREPESEDQNHTSKVLVVEGPNKDGNCFHRTLRSNRNA